MCVVLTIVLFSVLSLFLRYTNFVIAGISHSLRPVYTRELAPETRSRVSTSTSTHEEGVVGEINK